MSDDFSLTTNILDSSRIDHEEQTSVLDRTRNPHQSSSIAAWPDESQQQQMQTGQSSQPAQANPSMSNNRPHNFGESNDRSGTLNTQSPSSPWYDTESTTTFPSPLPISVAGLNHRSFTLRGPVMQSSYYPGSTTLGHRNSAESQVAADDFSHISHTLRGSTVRVSHLDAMLRSMALSRNGVKKVKVERLLFTAQQYVNSRNFEGLHHMRQIVDSFGPHGDPAGAPQRVRPMTYTEAVNSINTPPPPPQPSIPASTAPNPLVSPKKGGPIHTPLSFQRSPFYTLETPLATPMFFIRPYTRRRVQQTSRFRINPNLLLDDTNRVYLVSQQFLPQAQNSRPVYFPFYIDITLDDQTVKANTRGVRGSVGSAKPVDLTSHLKTKPGNTRSLTVTIHISDQNQYETISDKSFAMGIYFAQKMPLHKLVSQIRDQKQHFTVDQTKKQLNKASADEEGIESMAMRFSLRDAVMRTRIKQPMRSQLCEHIDCFDAESYFMLQDQAETWKCPVCNRRITYESLLFDDFFMDILSKTPENVDAVEISPDGQWSIPSQDSESDSGESGDGDEKPPPNKRSRMEPDIEVVDLLSDTDEETPEPVKPVPSRGLFESGQAPRSPRLDTQTTSNANNMSHHTPHIAEDLSRIRQPEKNLNGQENSSKSQNEVEVGEQENQATRQPNNPVSSEDSGLRLSPQQNDHGLHEVPNMVNEQTQAKTPGSTESPTPSSDPSSPPPPHPAEPRFQIAQMLQSFRSSNSVLFQKSLPYSPSYRLLWGKQGREQSNDGRDQSLLHGRASSQSGANAEEAAVPPLEAQSEHEIMPEAEGQSALAVNQPDLSDEDVIDLTGDD